MAVQRGRRAAVEPGAARRPSCTGADAATAQGRGERPAELDPSDADTPVGRILLLLQQSSIFDIDETPAATDARRASEDAAEQADPEFWERLTRETLGVDHRADSYKRLRDRSTLLEDDVFALLSIMLNRAPGEMRLRLLAGDVAQSGDSEPAHKTKWSTSARLRVRVTNVLRRWSRALADPRLRWLSELAPVRNYLALLMATGALWQEEVLDQARAATVLEDLFGSFVRRERTEGYLAALDDNARQQALAALPDEAGELAAALLYCALRPEAPWGGYIFDWQPFVIAGLEWGVFSPGQRTLDALEWLVDRRPSLRDVEERLFERVPIECYLRNVADHEIAFSYATRIYSEELPEVRDDARPAGAKKVQGVLLTGLDSALALVLRSGETIVLWHPGLVLGDNPAMTAEPGKRRTGLERWPYLEDPKQGDYLVRQSVRYHLRTLEEVKRLTDRSHDKNSVLIEPQQLTLIRPDGSTYRAEVAFIPYFDEQAALVTGEARFTIAANAAPERQISGSGAKATDAASGVPKEKNGVYWGAVVDGLQAGLRAPKNRRRFAQGETMKLDFLIRNVGKQAIRFQYETHPGVKMTVPEVIAANGRVMAVNGTPGALISTKAQTTLNPGASIVIGQTSLGLSSTVAFPHDAFSRIDADTGKYRIAVLHQIRRDDKDVILYTGEMPFELLAKPQP